MREIWELQPRLEQREGKRPHRLVGPPPFSRRLRLPGVARRCGRGGPGTGGLVDPFPGGHGPGAGRDDEDRPGRSAGAAAPCGPGGRRRRDPGQAPSGGGDGGLNRLPILPMSVSAATWRARGPGAPGHGRIGPVARQSDPEGLPALLPRPLGPADQPDYVNAVVGLETRLSPRDCSWPCRPSRMPMAGYATAAALGPAHPGPGYSPVRRGRHRRAGAAPAPSGDPPTAPSSWSLWRI